MEAQHARRARVERLERDYAAAPVRYAVRVALLAAFGYAVLGSALVFTLGVTLLLIVAVWLRPLDDAYIYIPLIALAAMSVTLLRGFWIRLGLPEGHLLEAGEAPALRAEVERIRQALGAGQLHGIVIDADFNAAAAYLPNGFGLWRQRHYLVLGLPLLQALDRDELASVIAHEFGHFRHGHGRLHAWVYRLRTSLRRLAGQGAISLTSQQPLWLFLRWYAPYFDDHSFVLARRQEHAADEAARTVAGLAPAASALVRVAWLEDWLSREFWPQVEASAAAQAHPPVQVYARLAGELATQRQRLEQAPAWLLAHAPDPADTHPGLARRLEALGADSGQRLPEAGAPAAAELLGAELVDRLEQRFSREWQAREKPDWEVRHRALQEEARRLEVLRAHPTRTPEEWLEYAALVERHQPHVDAAPLYREGLRHRSGHAAGHCRLGVALLRQGYTDEGLEHLERAMRLEPAMIPLALHELDGVLRPLPAGAPLHAAAAGLRAAFAPAAARAGADVAEDDGFAPHDLDAEALRALCRDLAGYERIACAWLVRQRAPGLSVRPHYLLLLDWRGSMASEQAALPRLGQQLALPGTFGVLTTSQRTALLRRLRPRAGEPVYRRR